MPSGIPPVAEPSIHPPPATPKPPSVVFGPNKDFSFYQINHNPPQPLPTPPYHLYSPHHQPIPPFHPSPSYLPPPILVPAPNLVPVEPVILVSEPHVPLVASAVPVVTPGPPVLVHHTGDGGAIHQIGIHRTPVNQPPPNVQLPPDLPTLTQPTKKIVGTKSYVFNSIGDVNAFSYNLTDGNLDSHFGLHPIYPLATDKPTVVVDDQVWQSNQFRAVFNVS